MQNKKVNKKAEITIQTEPVIIPVVDLIVQVKEEIINGYCELSRLRQAYLMIVPENAYYIESISIRVMTNTVMNHI